MKIYNDSLHFRKAALANATQLGSTQRSNQEGVVPSDLRRELKKMREQKARTVVGRTSATWNSLGKRLDSSERACSNPNAFDIASNGDAARKVTPMSPAVRPNKNEPLRRISSTSRKASSKFIRYHVLNSSGDIRADLNERALVRD